MNTQYALIQHLLKDPSLLSKLGQSGFKSKYFKDESYGELYDLIFERYSKYNSVPTNEELKKFKVTIEQEVIPHSFDHCVTLIVEDAKKRSMSKVITSAAETLLGQGSDAARDLFLREMAKLPKFEEQQRNRDISTTTDNFLERYNFRAAHKGEIIGLRTGLPTLDNVTMGLMPQWLVVIAGRNQSGKTWLLSNWIEQMWNDGKNIAVFSCEMSVEELEVRIHALACKLPPTKVQHGLLDINDVELLKEHLRHINKGTSNRGKLTINDNPISMDNIDIEVQNMVNDGPLDVIFIDSVYRIGDTDTGKQADIARKAKNLAKKYNIPVVVTVQLNREFAKANAGKSKTLSGGFYVAGTDAWNQDADLILAINRPESYDKFNYNDLLMDKFRHGPPKNMIIEVNLNEPKIQEVDDYEKAMQRIQAVEEGGVAAKGAVLFDQVKDKMSEEKVSMFADGTKPSRRSSAEKLQNMLEPEPEEPNLESFRENA